MCSIVAGLTLGLAGSLAGRALAEGIYDEAARPPPVGAERYPGHSTVCPSCHSISDRATSMPVDLGNAARLESIFFEASNAGAPRLGELSPGELELISGWLESNTPL